MKLVTLTQAKASLSALVDEAEAGEVIIITRYGKPVAKLTAMAPEDRARVQRAAI